MRLSFSLPLVFLVVAARGQEVAPSALRGGAFHEGPHQEAVRLEGTGQVRFAVTAADPWARAFFDQGLGLVHGAWFYEAERSFHQVLALEPDSPMAYWGMALANLPNPERRIWFAWEAFKRRTRSSPRERKYIEALARFASAETAPETVLVDPEYGRREAIPRPVTAAHWKTLADDLLRIVTSHPKDVEAKALLVMVRALGPDEARDSSPPSSEDLMRQILSAAPRHPASRHLLAKTEGAGSLAAAWKATAAAPGIARVWGDAGQTFARAGRYDDAELRFQTGSRVDNAHMARTGAVPYELPAYPSNNASWCKVLVDAGRFQDAESLARRMIRMPRHPRWGADMVESGQRALAGALAASGRWGDLKEALSTPYLAGYQDGERLAELVAERRHDDAVKVIGEAAVSAAAALADSIKKDWASGTQGLARQKLNRLRTAFPNLDPDAAPFQGLEVIATSMGLPSNWIIRRPRPDLAKHGPDHWDPLPAPLFELPRGRGGSLGLKDYEGRPVLVVFYLGAACLHCVEQIHSIKPKARAFKRAGIEIVTIGTDTVSEVKAFIQQLDETGESPMPFPLLADPDVRSFKEWACWDNFKNEPLHGTFLIDGRGRVRWRDISVEPFMETDFLLEEFARLLSFDR